MDQAEEAFLLDRLAEDVERALLGKIDRMRVEAPRRLCGLELVQQRKGGVGRGAVGEVHVEFRRGKRPHDRGAEALAAAGDEDAAAQAARPLGSAPRTKQVFWPPKPKEDRKSTRLNSSHGYISYA